MCLENDNEKDDNIKSTVFADSVDNWFSVIDSVTGDVLYRTEILTLEYSQVVREISEFLFGEDEDEPCTKSIEEIKEFLSQERYQDLNLL